MHMADRPWTAFYEPGVPAEIDAPAYRTLADLVRAVAET